MALVTKTTNFIKSQGLNHRQFRRFLEEIGADYGYSCEACKLSREEMLRRFCEFIEEVVEFLRNENKDKEVASLTDPAWQADYTFWST